MVRRSCWVLLLAGCAASPPWLIRMDDVPPGDDCAAGGAAVHAGPDEDGDGALSDAEIAQTEFVCAVSTLVRTVTEPPGDDCPAGGLAVEVGTDVDGDGTLGDAEVQQAFYVCHGEQGLQTLVRVDPEDPGPHCEFGGLAVHAGTDADGDGVLSDPEIEATRYVCDGEGSGPDLTTIEGTYSIQNSLDIALLQGVETITGQLRIESMALSAIRIPTVEQVGRLENLSCGGLEQLELPSLRVVDETLSLSNCNDLAVLDLGSLEQVGGDLTLRNLSALTDLDAAAVAFVGGSLSVARVPVQDASAFGALEESGGSVAFDVTALEDLTGLESLVAVGGLRLPNNQFLASLDGLQGLRTIHGGLDLRNNPSLADVSAAEGVTSVGDDFVVRDNPSLPTCAAEALRDAIGTDDIGGDITISGNDDEGVCP